MRRSLSGWLVALVLVASPGHGVAVLEDVRHAATYREPVLLPPMAALLSLDSPMMKSGLGALRGAGGVDLGPIGSDSDTSSEILRLLNGGTVPALLCLTCPVWPPVHTPLTMRSAPGGVLLPLGAIVMLGLMGVPLHLRLATTAQVLAPTLRRGTSSAPMHAIARHLVRFAREEVRPDRHRAGLRFQRTRFVSASAPP